MSSYITWERINFFGSSDYMYSHAYLSILNVIWFIYRYAVNNKYIKINAQILKKFENPLIFQYFHLPGKIIEFLDTHKTNFFIVYFLMYFNYTKEKWKVT